MTDRVDVQGPQKLSQEEGFVSFEMFRPPYAHKIPGVPGLLAFLHQEDGSEMVLRLLLLDDLAKGYAQSRPFCGYANFAAYRVFPLSDDIDQHKAALAERLRVYAQLTEKYNAPQTVWRLDEYATIPPL
jgi:hypothetical protein